MNVQANKLKNVSMGTLRERLIAVHVLLFKKILPTNYSNIRYFTKMLEAVVNWNSDFKPKKELNVAAFMLIKL